MTKATEKERILDQMEALFDELGFEDVTEILTISLASVIAESSSDQTEAMAFLAEINRDVADYLRHIDYEAIEAEVEAEGTEKPPGEN